MPGTLVRDALAPALHTGITFSGAGGTGTAQRVSKPGRVTIEASFATVTGTNPTFVAEIQGADDSAFTTNVVTHGTFDTTTGNAASQSNTKRKLTTRSDKEYMRAIVTLAGTTPVYTGATIYVRQADDRRTPLTDTA